MAVVHSSDAIAWLANCVPYYLKVELEVGGVLLS